MKKKEPINSGARRKITFGTPYQLSLIVLTIFFQITVPAELAVLMSAVRVGEPQTASTGKRVHSFNQKIPIQVSNY